MLKSQIKNYTLLVIGIISIILSVLVLSKGRKLLELVIYLIGGLLIITNLLNLLLVPFKKYKFIDTLIKTTINVIFGISIMFFSKYIITSFTLIFALYTLLISIVNIISYVIYVENNIKGKLNVFINAITSLIFTVILLINPTLNIKYVLIILSIYLIIFHTKIK